MIGLLKRQSERKNPAATVAAVAPRPQNTSQSLTPIAAMNAAADVRLTLAGRVVTLLPDLPDEKHAQLYAYTVQMLGTLALDEILKIRQALSSALKDLACAPPKVAEQLARDVERDVSEPILRFCTGLSDADLLDIIRSHPVANTLKSNEIKKLPSLSSADVNETRLQAIVQNSKNVGEWKAHTTEKPTLPASLTKDLAELVDACVRDILMNKADFDSRTTEEITAVFRRRLNRMIGRGKQAIEFNDETIADSLALREYDFILAGLAHKLKTPKTTIIEIFETRSAKSIVALCWKAGLSMRTALSMQRDIGLIPPAKLIYPKGGTDYPFTRQEILWQLEFLGFKG